MTDLQIRTAAERLKIETELDKTRKKLNDAEWEITCLENALKKLTTSPTDYFEAEDNIKKLFNPQP